MYKGPNMGKEGTPIKDQETPTKISLTITNGLGENEPKGEKKKSAFGEEWNNMITYNEVPSGKDLCENLNIYL